MKKLIPYIFALCAGVVICVCLRPSLQAKRHNALLGGECLAPVYCIAGTAFARNWRRMKDEWRKAVKD